MKEPGRVATGMSLVRLVWAEWYVLMVIIMIHKKGQLIDIHICKCLTSRIFDPQYA